MHKMIRQLITLCTAAGFMLMAAPLFAAKIQLYSDYDLERAKQVYEPNVREIFRQDLVRQLPAKDRAILARVRILIPKRGKHPLQFSARPQDLSIIVPVMSLKFIDDLSIVWAWFVERDCDTAYITSYLSSLLGYNKIHVGPMQAFHLPMSVTKDSRVNSLSLKLSKTAIYFLLAHEAGHIVLKHQYTNDKQVSRTHENAADNYALSAMERIGVMPAGMLLYFMAGYMFEPLPDLQTWEYNEKVIAELTHPLVSQRIHLIADRLAAQPLNFVHSEPNPMFAKQLVVNMARQIKEIANHMDHGGVKLYSASWLLEHYPSSKFVSACQVN